MYARENSTATTPSNFQEPTNSFSIANAFSNNLCESIEENCFERIFSLGIFAGSRTPSAGIAN